MKKQQVIQIPTEFKPLFDDDWREAAVYGGRASTKSHSVARMLLIKAREKKVRVACFREFQNSIADSSHQLFKDLIELYGLTDFKVTSNAIVNEITGSDFLFKGLKHNEQSVKSIEGIDYAWVEEAQTISNSSIEILTPTVRKKGSKIIYTYNRLLDIDPVHVRLVLEGRPNTLVINVNYDVAEKYGFLSDVIKEEIEDDKANRPMLYKHKWLGEPVDGSVRLFASQALVDMFKIVPPEDDDTAYLSVDVAGGGESGDKTVFARFVGSEVWIESFRGLRSDDIEEKILEYEAKYQIPRGNIIMDGVGIGDSIADRERLRGIVVFKGSYSPVKTDRLITKAIDEHANEIKPSTSEFKNLRAQAYFKFAEAVANRKLRVHCSVEEADELRKELSVTTEIEGKSKIQIISKDDIKTIVKHSPDIADAVCQRYFYDIIKSVKQKQYTFSKPLADRNFYKNKITNKSLRS